MKVRIPAVIPLLASLALAGCGQPASDADPVAADVQRPRYDIDISDPYDSSRVAAYDDSHEEIYAHIDDNIAHHTAELQRWLRQPSISAQDVGVREMAEMVRDDLEALGFAEAELVPTDGHPGVWGYYDAGADRTLMIYMMYDVQPVVPGDWESPPFEANIVDHPLGKAIMARGAANQKGPQRALLNALDSIIAVTGSLPVNVMITAEGEEELGSPNYPQIIDAYEQRLRSADGVVFPFLSQRLDGTVNLNLGVKGIIYFEVSARGDSWGGPTRAEIHGSYKAIVDSPVWRLNKALSSLVSEDGNTILVEGYYDDVRPPTAEEGRLIGAILQGWNDQAMRDLFAVERWLDDRQGLDVLHEMIYQPTLNIDGLWSGYTGPGTKTILPHVATAKVDSRLPVGVDPEEALARIRKHLDGQGYSDVQIELLSGYPAAQTSVETAIVQSTIGIVNKWAQPPAVMPRLTGSAPFYQFTERLQLPMVPFGLGHGAGAHAPNEVMVVESSGPVLGLADIEKSWVDLLYAFARQD
jgi:acetylornithine deacetylase/succinyl-diaminopimelate desuccinylase-like protein